MLHIKVAVISLLVMLGLTMVLLAPVAGAEQDTVAMEEVAEGQEFLPGLNLDLYQSAEPLSSVARPVEGQTPNLSLRVERPEITGPIRGYDENYVVHFSGELIIERGGFYAFRLQSDGGSKLLIDGQVVIDNNGPDGLNENQNEIRIREKGPVPFEIWFFQGQGDQSLSLQWRPTTHRDGGKPFEDIPDELFRCEAGQTRVIAPGSKRLVAWGTKIVPGVQAPLDAVHPMWKLTTLSPKGPEDFELLIGGMAYLPGGRLAITTFNPRNNGKIVDEPNGQLWLLDGVDAPNPDDISVTLVDDQLFNPLGVLFHDGEIYVGQRDELTRYSPTDDGGFGKRVTVTNGWETTNYHHFTFGPAYKDGKFYLALATSIGTGGAEVVRGPSLGYGPNPDGRGSVLEIDPATGEVEFITGGHRTPNGLFIGADGELFVGENQGAWQPANKINHVIPGRFYGHYNGNHHTEEFPEGSPPSRFADQPLTPPAVYLPHNEIANSPTDGVLIKDGPFAGQMLVSDVKHGGLRRVSVEKVNGEYQGAAYRHSQGFNAGLNRLAWGEDGTLYVGGIGAAASWSWRGTIAGLQRLDPTGQTAFEFDTVTATPTGLRLSYTRAVPAEQLNDLDSYTVEQWRYKPTRAYGGPKFDQEALEVESVLVASDRRSVELVIPGIKAGRVIYLMHQPTSDDGEAMWSPEVWYSMNQIPGQKLELAEMTEPVFRTLIFSKTAGYRHKSIKDGIRALYQMSRNNGWDSMATEDDRFFTAKDLSTFDVVIFLNTSGDILNDEQKAAFEGFIRNGGGFVGIHAATDTEHSWPWYNQLVGGYFASHPKIQPAELEVLIPDHPSTEHLPERWKRTDEWYDFKDLVPSLNVLINLDETTYRGGKMGEVHPIAWYREFDGGRSWYTAGGHTAESYREEDFMKHVQGGIEWAGGLKD